MRERGTDTREARAGSLGLNEMTARERQGRESERGRDRDDRGASVE